VPTSDKRAKAHDPARPEPPPPHRPADTCNQCNPPAHIHEDDGTVEGCPGCFCNPPVDENWMVGEIERRAGERRSTVLWLPATLGAFCLLAITITILAIFA
jgi:hypothetical protein